MPIRLPFTAAIRAVSASSPVRFWLQWLRLRRASWRGTKAPVVGMAILEGPVVITRRLPAVAVVLALTAVAPALQAPATGLLWKLSLRSRAPSPTGQAFRFKDDKRPKLLVAIAEPEYDTAK